MELRDGVSHPCSEKFLSGIYVLSSPVVVDEDQMASDFVRVYAHVCHSFPLILYL